jgi:hypothetical protein
VTNYVFVSVGVFLGNGAGGFGARTDFATGFGPISVAIADINVDGKPDLVATDYASNTVSVLLGDGAGSFGARTAFATGSHPHSVAIRDLNGDGRPDLGVANFISNTVSVLLALTPTKTVLAASPNPVSQGSLLTLTATMTVPPGITGANADSVRFFDGFTLLGTSSVIHGSAVLSLAAPYPGERSLTAVYKGDGRLCGSISPVQIVRVSPATQDVGDRAPLAFALEGVRPNPSRGGQLSVTFALPSSTPARLELIDVSGRRIVTRDVGALGAGPHVVALAANRALRPGLYLVRLEQGANVRVTRVAVLN